MVFILGHGKDYISIMQFGLCNVLVDNDYK